MRIPSDRYDWAVLYLSIFVVVCSVPLGIGELWFGPSWFLSLLFGPVALATVLFAIVAIVRRDKPIRVFAYLAISTILCCVTLNRNLGVAIAIGYFERNRDRYDRSTVAVMSEHGKKRKLPASLRDLTYDGNVRYMKDPDGDNEFLVYRKVYDGIDNGFGYIWSKSQVSIEQVPYYAEDRVRRIDSHWFYVRLT